MAYGDTYRPEQERKILARMRKLRAAGHGYPTIAAMLNEEGHPAPRGRRWYPSVVRGILLRSHHDLGPKQPKG
jgi:hypothetical protein